MMKKFTPCRVLLRPREHNLVVHPQACLPGPCFIGSSPRHTPQGGSWFTANESASDRKVQDACEGAEEIWRPNDPFRLLANGGLSVSSHTEQHLTMATMTRTYVPVVSTFYLELVLCAFIQEKQGRQCPTKPVPLLILRLGWHFANILVMKLSKMVGCVHQSRVRPRTFGRACFGIPPRFFYRSANCVPQILFSL